MGCHEIGTNLGRVLVCFSSTHPLFGSSTTLITLNEFTFLFATSFLIPILSHNPRLCVPVWQTHCRSN
jgi:hypothetical protein